MKQNQHYVPQLILRNFCVSDQIFVFDKKDERIFKTNIRNIAVERGFYDFDFKDEKLTLEAGLSKLEAKADITLKKIIENKTLSIIEEKEKISFANFIAIQFARVKAMRLRYKRVDEVLKEKINEFGFNINETEEFKEFTENDLKVLTARTLIKGEFTPHFLNKTWVLLETTEENPYYISDNPIVLQNMLDTGPYGNLGLAVKGIEIYFPVSKTLTLAMHCKSHEMIVKDVYDKYQIIKKHKPELLKNHDVDLLLKYLNAFKSGEAVKITKDNVINLNSLQVGYATRYVYSNKEDFMLAKEMIKQEPDLKNPVDIGFN